MSLGEIGRLAAGVAIVACGLWVIVRNRAVGDYLAGIENDATRSSSLLNRDRVERLAATVDDPRTRVLDRGKAIFLGVWLASLGATLVANALP